MTQEGTSKMMNKLRQLIDDGEGLTVEFKRCENDLANNIYETVSAFSNRYGGYILLGVEDNGKVSGVNPKAVKKIKKDFVNALNNPQRFAPTLFLSLEEADVEGKTILWCYVPQDSQVVMFGGKIYDRTEDGDIDITRNSMMVTQIHQRKTADYSERKIFPFAKEKDFEFERLLPLVRRLAVTHRANHPWERMSDKDLLKSAGLYRADPESGKSGYTLAAVLLFGREELIRACTPNYVTDAICRRENLDRYDDRLMVSCNLIDAYDRLIEFIAKHTLDRFHIVNNQSVSLRSKIARELVSNILVHREYTSAFPAKIIIERDRIVTENWSLPKTPGRINPDDFAPYPKNPLLSHFFVNIGRADVLGSGVRNLYRFTKLYSGGEPELVDGDIFKTIVPLNLSFKEVNDNNEILNDKVGDNQILNDKVNDKVGDNQILNDNQNDNSEDRKRILAYIVQNGVISTTQAAQTIERSHSTARRVLLQLVSESLLVSSGANRNKTYRLKTTSDKM